MVLQANQLKIERCPHCSVAKPLLRSLWKDSTKAFSGDNHRMWVAYGCNSCGGVVLTHASLDLKKNGNADGIVERMYPTPREVDETVPVRAREYLRQALDSLSASAGAVMLAACSIDAMLQEKGYQNGTLYSRIQQAAKDNLITSDMEKWAHEIRLEANDQRHADPSSSLPTSADANRVIEFALALAEFLFVLPARVKRGLKSSTT